MSLTYTAKLLSKETEEELVKNLQEGSIERMVDDFINDEENSILIGRDDDSWAFSAVNNYLIHQQCYPEMGSKIGQYFSRASDFMELYIPHHEMKDVLGNLEKIDSRKDDNFKTFLKNILTEWEKPDYADEIEKYIESYHEIADSIKTTLNQAYEEKKSFIVLIPF